MFNLDFQREVRLYKYHLRNDSTFLSCHCDLSVRVEACVSGIHLGVVVTLRNALHSSAMHCEKLCAW